MEYNGYLIRINDYRNSKHPNCDFIFHNLNDCDEVIGTGESIKYCQEQIDERNLFEIHEHANYLECEFINWIKIKGWQYINPLDVYQHKNKEVYKTKSELKDIFLSQRHS